MTDDRPVLVDSALSVRGRLVLEIQNDIVRTRTLIQTQMTQKLMLRAEVYARALRASQNRKENSV